MYNFLFCFILFYLASCGTKKSSFSDNVVDAEYNKSASDEDEDDVDYQDYPSLSEETADLIKDDSVNQDSILKRHNSLFKIVGYNSFADKKKPPEYFFSDSNGIEIKFVPRHRDLLSHFRFYVFYKDSLLSNYNSILDHSTFGFDNDFYNKDKSKKQNGVIRFMMPKLTEADQIPRNMCISFNKESKKKSSICLDLAASFKASLFVDPCISNDVGFYELDYSSVLRLKLGFSLGINRSIKPHLVKKITYLNKKLSVSFVENNKYSESDSTIIDSSNKVKEVEKVGIGYFSDIHIYSNECKSNYLTYNNNILFMSTSPSSLTQDTICYYTYKLSQDLNSNIGNVNSFFLVPILLKKNVNEFQMQVKSKDNKILCISLSKNKTGLSFASCNSPDALTFSPFSSKRNLPSFIKISNLGSSKCLYYNSTKSSIGFSDCAGVANPILLSTFSDSYQGYYKFISYSNSDACFGFDSKGNLVHSVKFCNSKLIIYKKIKST